MKLLRKLLALLIAFAMMVLLPLAVWNLAAYATLLNPDTVKDGLATQGIYEEVVPVVLPVLAADEPPVGVNQQTNRITEIITLVNNTDPQAWHSIANRIVPPDWIRSVVESTIDQVYAAAEGSALPPPAVDYTPIVEQLTGSAGQSNAILLLEAMPACTLAQTRTLNAVADGASESALPLCLPRLPAHREIVLNEITHAMGTLAHFLDTQASAPFFLSPEDSGGLLRLGLVVRVYRQMTGLFFLIPAALLALVVALAVRSLKGFSLWSGWIAISSALVALIPLIILPLTILSTMGELLVPITSERVPALDVFMRRLLGGLASSAFTQFTAPVLLQIGVLLGAGVLLLIVSSIAPVYYQTLASAVGSTPLPNNQTLVVPGSQGRTRPFSTPADEDR